MKNLNRRAFLATSAAGLFVASSPSVWSNPAKKEVRLGFVGVGGRGLFLTSFVPNVPNARIVAVCDADSGRLATACKNFPDAKPYADMRDLFDDKEVDAVVIATCNHWHVLAAIWAMQAGKDVYVEKPLALTFKEGWQLVKAAKNYGKICQIGTQMRSDPEHHPEAKEFLHEKKELGAIQSVRVSRFSARGGIGKRSTPLTPPANVDYNLWLGPSTDRPIYRNNLHYDWHWMWNTGNGETGNWGAHLLDDVRNDVFCDKIAAPKRVLAGGARVGYDDAGDTPNSLFAFFDTGSIPVVFCISNLPDKKNPKTAGELQGPSSGYVVRCEGGRYEKHWGGAVAFDENGKKIREFKATAEHDGPLPHLTNFVQAVLARDASILCAPIQVGFDSSYWYNGANAAYRLGEPYSKKDALAVSGSEGLLEGAINDLEKHLNAQGIEMNADSFKLSRFLEYDEANLAIKGEYADAAAKLFDIQYRAPFAVPEIDD